MTPQTMTPQTRKAAATRFNRAALALTEAEALGVNLADPFCLGWAEGPEAEAMALDLLIYGRDFPGLI